MPLHHTVVFMNHHCAKILQFGPEYTKKLTVNAHLHLSGQDKRNEHSKHEFFGKVCDGLDGVTEVLVVGGHTSMMDFEHYVQKYRPATATHIAGYMPVDHTSDNELVVLARQWFTHHTQMTDIAV